jgi:hypothetical protein
MFRYSIGLLVICVFVQCRWIASKQLHAPYHKDVETKEQLLAYVNRISPFPKERILYIKPEEMKGWLNYPSLFPDHSWIWNAIWKGKRDVGSVLFRESDPQCIGVTEKALKHWMSAPDWELDTTGVVKNFEKNIFLRRMLDDSIVDFSNDELFIVLTYTPMMGFYHKNLWKKLYAMEKLYPNRKTYLLCFQQNAAKRKN